MMEHPENPPYMNGYEEDPIFQNSHYTQDISEQMRVPKRIKATGEFYDEFDTLPNGNTASNNWGYQDKFNMTVPDRIVVLGQDQHLGTRSAPREIVLDNSVLPANPNYIRVSTPPRTITLSEHHFPSASDEPQFTPEEDQSEYESHSVNTVDDRRMVLSKQNKYFSQDVMNQSSREATPPLGPSGEGLTPSEEVLYLRRQLSKLNRRVLSIEIENVQRQQRDKIVYCIGLAYFFIKAFMWLGKN